MVGAFILYSAFAYGIISYSTTTDLFLLLEKLCLIKRDHSVYFLSNWIGLWLKYRNTHYSQMLHWAMSTLLVIQHLMVHNS